MQAIPTQVIEDEGNPADELLLSPENQLVAMKERVRALGITTMAKFQKAVTARRQIEDRWLEDLRQFNSQYDLDVVSEIKMRGGSEVFINLTRPRTITAASRLQDICLPTDDNNFDVKPSPNPQLADHLADNTAIGTTPEGAEVTAKDMAKALKDDAKDRAEKMKTLIADQLNDNRYNSKARDSMLNGALLGCGILKGPFPLIQTATSFQKINGKWTQVVVDDVIPGISSVDPWHYFPYPVNVPSREACEFECERHLMTIKHMRDMAKQPGFDAEAIGECVQRGPNMSASGSYFLSEMMNISGSQTSSSKDMWEVVEYHGPITYADLAAAGYEFDEGVDTSNDIDFVDGIVWSCGETVIKAVLDPIMVGDRPFSVFPYEPDPTCVFGKGIPRLGRSSQRVLNATYRMMLDNAALTVRPNFIIDKGTIPQDGKYEIRPGKGWIRDPEMTPPGSKGIEFLPVPAQLEWMMQLFNTAHTLIDEETNLPAIASGNQNNHQAEATETVGMKMDAANTVLRRAVKAWDDYITIPLITRLIAWNMKFSDDESIKGDLRPMALGSSHLMEKERQADLLMKAMQIAASPTFAPFNDLQKLNAELMRALKVSDIVLDDETVKRNQEQAQQAAQQQAQAQQQQPAAPPPPDSIKMQQMELDKARLEFEGRKHEENMSLEMVKLEHKEHINDLMAQLALARDKLRESAANDRINAEVQVKETMGSGL